LWGHGIKDRPIQCALDCRLWSRGLGRRVAVEWMNTWSCGRCREGYTSKCNGKQGRRKWRYHYAVRIQMRREERSEKNAEIKKERVRTQKGQKRLGTWLQSGGVPLSSKSASLQCAPVQLILGVTKGSRACGLYTEATWANSE
jgi:hypothetical protein